MPAALTQTTVEKQWRLASSFSKDVVLQILANRGITTPEAVEGFLRADYYRDVHDPFLFNDMERAVARLHDAIAKHELIFVYGDYDADGVSGAVIIKSVLDELGASTSVYLPHVEKEGYGINVQAIEYIDRQNGKVIVSCDCGISNVSEVEEARHRGIDVIIADHHTLATTLPSAYAILHPLVSGETYPNPYLTGGGVAFKLAQALVARDEAKRLAPGYEKWLLDMVAISTVSDMGKLVGENRTLVKYGLLVLQRTRRLGLKKMYQLGRIQSDTIDAETIGYQIAPRINAARRMDHANVAFELLITDKEEDALRLAGDLERLNTERQKVLADALTLALSHITEPRDAIFVFHQELPAGVLGLLASRIKDTYQLPTFVLTRSEGKLLGSGRSVETFNLMEALPQMAEYLIKFGGHPQACGFTVKDEEAWNSFATRMRELAAFSLKSEPATRPLEVDVELDLNEINRGLLDELLKLEPHGMGNPRPRFLSRGVRVHEIIPLGAKDQHVRLLVSANGGVPKKIVAFGFGTLRETLPAGSYIDLVYEISENNWNGRREIQLKLVDWRYTL